MEYDALKLLREQNPAWRLLAAETAPFAAAFFYRAFLRERRRAIGEEELISLLVDFIYETRVEGDVPPDPQRSAQMCLTAWADGQHAWLRKFYGHENEVVYDLTAAAQKAVEWLAALKKRTFIGTESRLRTVFSLLREIVRETDTDAAHRLAYLREQRDRLTEEIAVLEETGEVVPSLSFVQLKERLLQAVQTGEGILSDFREVEENFRDLERKLMADLMTWKEGKGELLDRIFSERDIIRSSEQGRSFEAFWQFLMMGVQREALAELMVSLARVEELQPVLAENPIYSMPDDWLRAAVDVEQMVSRLDKQVRRLVDVSTLAEERHIYRLIADAEAWATRLSDVPQGMFMTMEAAAPEIALPMDRRMFVLPKRMHLGERDLVDGVAEGSVAALFREEAVDAKKLAAQVDAMLEGREAVTLAEIIAAYPLQQGIAELLTYLAIASRRRGSEMEDGAWQEIFYTRDGHRLAARCEAVVFHREEQGK